MLLAAWKSQPKGVFLGEAAYVSATRSYSRTKEEAEAILHEYLKREGKEKDYVYFPYQVVYAMEGGYLFVVGEFKHNIPLRGYRVDGAGTVSFVDLGKTIDIAGYRGARN